MVTGRRLDFPATRRNREPIFAVLKAHLPETGVVLEIAAGSGQHAAAFAPRLPQLTWQPSDLDPTHVASCTAWAESLQIANIAPALLLDACAPSWPIAEAAAIFAANMIHIAPWAACEGLIRGAQRILPAGGALILYGPFLRHDVATAPSNAAFDASLQARDPTWGVRQLEQVTALAEAHGFDRRAAVEMPANNLTVVFERRP